MDGCHDAAFYRTSLAGNDVPLASHEEDSHSPTPSSSHAVPLSSKIRSGGLIVASSSSATAASPPLKKGQ